MTPLGAPTSVPLPDDTDIDNYPAHRTFREFRKLHLKEISALFAPVVRLAMAAIGQKETKLADLRSELGITRQTLCRHVAPDRALRKSGLKVVERGKTRNPHGLKQ